MRNMNDCSLAAALGRYDPQYSSHSRTMADDRSELQPATAGEIACTAHTTQHWYIYNIQTLYQWLLLAVILICMLFILCMIVLYSQKLFYCLPKNIKLSAMYSICIYKRTAFIFVHQQHIYTERMALQGSMTLKQVLYISNKSCIVGCSVVLYTI